MALTKERQTSQMIRLDVSKLKFDPELEIEKSKLKPLTMLEFKKDVAMLGNILRKADWKRSKATMRIKWLSRKKPE